MHWTKLFKFFWFSTAKAHHTLADSVFVETPDILSETNLSGFLAHHTLADFLSPIFCRVSTSHMLDYGSKYHVTEITPFHWLQHIFVSRRQIVGDHHTLDDMIRQDV